MRYYSLIGLSVNTIYTCTFKINWILRTLLNFNHIHVQVDPRLVELKGPGLLSSEVNITSTIPIGCDCCSIWEQFGECNFFIDIKTYTTSIKTGLKRGNHCKYKLGRDIPGDTIPIVGKQRPGTSKGTFRVYFEPISIIFDQPGVSIWQGYTPPYIQVIVNSHHSAWLLNWNMCLTTFKLYSLVRMFHITHLLKCFVKGWFIDSEVLTMLYSITLCS